MRSALILASLALSILAAPLPVKQARHSAIDERSLKVLGDGTTYYAREAAPEALSDDLPSPQRREALPDFPRAGGERRDAEPEDNQKRAPEPGYVRADPQRRNAEPGYVRADPQRREAEAGYIRADPQRRDAEPGYVRADPQRRDAKPDSVRAEGGSVEPQGATI